MSFAHCFAPQGVAPEVAALLSTCPTPTVFVRLRGSGELIFGAANGALLALLRIDAAELAMAERGPAVLACLHDEREPAFRERVRAAARGEEASPLKVLAQRFGSAAPFALNHEPSGRLGRPGQVLLEARFLALAGGVVVFLEEARARGQGDLPEGVEATATQRAVYEISRATHEVPTLEALFERIHGIVERLIGAKNFYIALVDEAEQMLRFPYARDEFEVPRDRRMGLGVTDVVFLSGQPLLLDRAQANRMLAQGTIINHGVPAQVWLGVPLKVAGKTVGVLAVQDYHNPHFLGESERQILTYISDQIANAIAVKRAAAAADAAQAEAERAGRAKADFLAVMSHELRTPLTAVIGFADLLQESLGTSAEGRQAASIGQAGHRLLEAVNHMLDYSRVDALAQPVHEEAVDLEELLLVCQGFFSARMREKNLTFSVRREGFVPECVRSDSQILKQIVIHLLGNAVKFTSTGGRIRLLVRAEPLPPAEARRHRVELTVEDNGIGIAPEMLPCLFEPFEQGQRPGLLQGAGLGLAISQRLAGLLGGRIAVRSTAGVGSAFTLSFNALAATRSGQPPQQPDATSQRELLLRSRLTGNEFVLVVDANADNRTIVAGLIDSVSGCVPRVAADGVEALAACDEAWPELVLIDVAGPDSDGMRTCREVRKFAGGRPRPRIVALSVDHSPALVQACLAAGADNYLPKPLSRRALIEALLAVLEK